MIVLTILRKRLINEDFGEGRNACVTITPTLRKNTVEHKPNSQKFYSVPEKQAIDQ